MSPRSSRPSMTAGSPTWQKCWSRQESKADGRCLGQPSCIGLTWARPWSWIPAIHQSRRLPSTISATCLKSDARPSRSRSAPLPCGNGLSTTSMNDNNHRGLLPAGLADLLPPDAAREAGAIGIAIERFAAFGYERVKPPLVEFEESLLGGPGAALAPQTFRLMDPVSQRMMGVRPDMTVQVARIAVTRLKHEPRPLRLSYGGNVIRVRGSALKPERQFAQVGAELIGVDTAEADAEAILLTVDALSAIGVPALTVDLNLPTLVAAVAAGLKIEDEPLHRLRRALDRKDETAIAKALGDKKTTDLFVGLLRSA